MNNNHVEQLINYKLLLSHLYIIWDNIDTQLLQNLLGSNLLDQQILIDQISVLPLLLTTMNFHKQVASLDLTRKTQIQGYSHKDVGICYMDLHT